MFDRGAKHLIYYAPNCEYCQELIEQLQQTRAVHDFNAFDVTMSDPPRYVTHVPTIEVLGTVMIGKDAFDWVKRLKYGGESNATSDQNEPALEPGMVDTSLETAGSFDPRIAEPMIVNPMNDPVSQQRSGIREEKIGEGGIDLEKLIEQRNKEIMMIPQLQGLNQAN